MADGFGSNNNTFGQESGASVVVIPLDAEPRAILSGRGRRRLRDIQAACHATVKLDRLRGLLIVCGNAESIKAVRRHIAGLTGPRKSITAAVWAELMRTRELEDVKDPQAALARIQEKSGIRIHIERSRHEVRLFGPPPEADLASKLIDEVASFCIEECVPTGDSKELISPALEVLAQDSNVTFRIEETQIVVLGLSEFVSSAVEQLKNYISNPEGYQQMADHLSPKDQMKQEGIQSSKPHAEEMEVTSDVDEHGLEVNQMEATTTTPPEHLQQKLAHAADHGACRECPTCGAGRFCPFCGNSTQIPKTDVNNSRACKTCGAGRFCVFCGSVNQIAKMKLPSNRRSSKGSSASCGTGSSGSTKSGSCFSPTATTLDTLPNQFQASAKFGASMSVDSLPVMSTRRNSEDKCNRRAYTSKSADSLPLMSWNKPAGASRSTGSLPWCDMEDDDETGSQCSELSVESDGAAAEPPRIDTQESKRMSSSKSAVPQKGYTTTYMANSTSQGNMSAPCDVQTQMQWAPYPAMGGANPMGMMPMNMMPNMMPMCFPMNMVPNQMVSAPMMGSPDGSTQTFMCMPVPQQQ